MKSDSSHRAATIPGLSLETKPTPNVVISISSNNRYLDKNLTEKIDHAL